MVLILGNAIALIASILMVYSGVLKTKKKILYVQSIQIGLSVISNLVLGGFTGAIINAISFFRNILCYKEKLDLKWKIIITLFAGILSICFNNISVIGFLPLISTVVYLWFMNTKNVIRFKFLIIFTMIMWGIYDYTIKSYTSSLFDFMNVIANLYSIYIIDKKINKKSIYLK